MVSPSRSSASPRQRDNAGRIVAGVLILLGLIASVFLIFSDSVQLVRVGLVAALWAAAVAAFAATRYRRDAAVDQAKARDLHKVYELQLEREITARREYELGVEARVREEVGAEAAEMAALRTELSVLRQSLQRLFDGELPVDRPALHAEVVRVQELTRAATANGSSQETDDWDPWNAPPVQLHVVSPVFDPGHESPAFASPYDDPVTAETAVVTDSDGNEADQQSEDAGQAQKAAEPSKKATDPTQGPADQKKSPGDQAKNPGDQAKVSGDGARNTGERAEVSAEQGKDATAKSKAASEAEKNSVTPPAAQRSDPASRTETSKTAPSTEKTPEPVTRVEFPKPPATAKSETPVGTANSQGRRHVDSTESTPGRKLTVAEIMANLRSEQGAK